MPYEIDAMQMMLNMIGELFVKLAVCVAFVAIVKQILFITAACY
ncbi:hypothetical protein MGA3_16548 [Bacillus methanolicus MGA3]|nr:hypothetical protein MGA3_16548 [Bacillus methanolicus MGA3]